MVGRGLRPRPPVRGCGRGPSRSLWRAEPGARREAAAQVSGPRRRVMALRLRGPCRELAGIRPIVRGGAGPMDAAAGVRWTGRGMPEAPSQPGASLPIRGRGPALPAAGMGLQPHPAAAPLRTAPSRREQAGGRCFRALPRHLPGAGRVPILQGPGGVWEGPGPDHNNEKNHPTSIK